MRRNLRKKQSNGLLGDKILMYSCIGVAVLAVIVFALLMYSKTLNEDVKNSQLSSDQIASIVDNDTNSESASSSIGKSIEEEEAKQNLTNTQGENNLNTTSNTVLNNSSNGTSSNTNSSNSQNNGASSSTTKKSNSTSNATNKNSNSSVNTQNTQETSATAQSNKTSESTDNKKELSFERPVEGDITREFAKENLIYSETLQEWVTHSGIDIKANKTTVVKAAEDGIIKSIKNDPRFGLTVVIEHSNGFQTVYSNLLTAEFVVEGENVSKGQTIATVGNTAVFEIVDEPHLHFEILKDSVQVDPSIYLK